MDEIIIETVEYGRQRGKIVGMGELDRIAKERNYYIKFMGIYSYEGEEYMTFFVQNHTVFVRK